MSLVTVIKHYDELTTDELYRVIQLRIQGFIVRNGTCYQDLEAHYDKEQWYMMT
jgi:predicted GNAT family N-acyltransferase